MRGPMQPGWYRRHGDAPHHVRKVSEAGTFWITCLFDVRQRAPCDAGGVLSAEAWHAFERAPDPGVVLA